MQYFTFFRYKFYKKTIFFINIYYILLINKYSPKRCNPYNIRVCMILENAPELRI